MVVLLRPEEESGAARAPGLSHYLQHHEHQRRFFATATLREISAGHLSRQSFIVCATEYTTEQRDREHAIERKKTKNKRKKKRNYFDGISEKLKPKN